jgi:hypothetical protein
MGEIGLCYIVTSWRDISSCGENMRFAVYRETEPKIIARGWPWRALFELGGIVALPDFALILIYRCIAI